MTTLLRTCIYLFQAPYNTVQYSLVGNARALEYFQVSASTGVVSLIKPVYVDTDVNNQYEVITLAVINGTFANTVDPRYFNFCYLE